MYILIKMVLAYLQKLLSKKKKRKRKNKIRNNADFLVWFIVPYTKKNHYINKL